MKKTLDTTEITNELKGSSHFFSPSPIENETTTSSDEVSQSKQQMISGGADQSTKQSASESINQPTNESAVQSINQSTKQSTRKSTDQPYDHSPILGRPKSFYITQQQDKDLDLAVDKLAAKAMGSANQKIDRSYLLRLLLEAANLTSERTIERLHGRLISRLVSQLTGQASR